MKNLLSTICLLLAVALPAFADSYSGHLLLSATALDNVGVVGVQIQVDGIRVGVESPNSPYSFTWDSSAVSDGLHIVGVVARDAAGNQGKYSTSITVDNTPPSISLTSPIPGSVVSGKTITVSASATDNIGMAGIQFQMDGVNLGALGGSLSGPSANSPFLYSVVWDTTNASNGTHTLTAIARDAAGNQKNSVVTSVTVNNVAANGPPGAFVKNSPSNAATVQPSGPSLSWGTSNGAASYEYCVDTTNNGSCDSNWISTTGTSTVLSGLSAGSTYWWAVRARNGYGTTDANSGTWWSFNIPGASRVNVAAAANGAVAIASSFINTGYPPASAINGDRKGTAWGNGGGWNDDTPDSYPDWLQVDFAGSQTINEIDVFTLQDDYINPVEPYIGLPFSHFGIVAFQVQYWDGFSWSIVPGGNIAANNQVRRQITFAPIMTPRIRVFVTGALNTWSRITEVEAYLDSGVINAPPGSLTKSGPGNSATGQSLIPTLTWGTSSGATSYEYCVDTTNNNTCDTDWTTTGSTNALIDGLKAGTTYFWQVRARNGFGTTDADIGAWWSFTTLFGGAVNVAAPVNGATATASSYFDERFAPNGAISGDRKGTAWENGGGWNDGTEDSFPDWLQVDFAGPQTINEIDVFTLQDAFSNPVEPFPGMKFTLWGITSFQVQYWNGLSWAVVPGGDIFGNNEVWRHIAFAAITTPRIRVVVSGSLNSWSRITKVEAYSDINVVPGQFSKISPTTQPTGKPQVGTLSWTASAGASSYEYCVDTINNNSCDTSWSSTINNNVVLSALSSGIYYWQVRARNGVNIIEADTGTWWSFTK